MLHRPPQAVDGVAELEEFSGVDPGWQRALPADTVVWWLALNQTCPFHAGSWQFLEFLAAASNGSFIELVSGQGKEPWGDAASLPPSSSCSHESACASPCASHAPPMRLAMRPNASPCSCPRSLPKTQVQLQVGPPLTILRSDSGFTQPSWLPEGGPSQPPPCGSARQNCCQDPQTYAASCTEPGLECMVHGPDAVCEAPRCAAPAPVEGRPGAFACPGGTMLVGTLVGPGG